MRGNDFLFLPYTLTMSQRARVGMCYRHSTMNRTIQTAGASNILIRLASQSITGHAPSIEVHQHYGVEYHLVLHRSKHRRHIAEYYNMFFKKHYWLNGSLLNQQKLSLPEITSMEFGIDETTQPLQIRRRLEAMRTTKC